MDLLQGEKLFPQMKSSHVDSSLNVHLRTNQRFFFRAVRVIKLISKDSIDECILQLGQKKLKLEQDMTAAGQGEQIHPPRKCSNS